MSPQSFTCGRKLCLTRGQKPQVYRSSSPPRHLKSFFFFFFTCSSQETKIRLTHFRHLSSPAQSTVHVDERGPLQGHRPACYKQQYAHGNEHKMRLPSPPEAHHCPPGLGLAASAVVGSQNAPVKSKRQKSLGVRFTKSTCNGHQFSSAHNWPV